MEAEPDYDGVSTFLQAKNGLASLQKSLYGPPDQKEKEALVKNANVMGCRSAKEPRPYLQGVLRKLDGLMDRAIREGDCTAMEALAIAGIMIEDRLKSVGMPSPVVRNGIKRYWSEPHCQYVTVPEE